MSILLCLISLKCVPVKWKHSWKTSLSGNLICFDCFPSRFGSASFGPRLRFLATPLSPGRGRKTWKPSSCSAKMFLGIVESFSTSWVWQLGPEAESHYCPFSFGLFLTLLTRGITKKQLTVAGVSKPFSGVFKGHMPCNPYTEIFWSCERTHKIL